MTDINPLRSILNDVLKDCSKETQMGIQGLLDATLAEIKKAHPNVRGLSAEGVGEVLVALILKGYRPILKPPLCTNEKICKQADMRLRRHKQKWLNQNRLTLIYRMKRENLSMVIRGKTSHGESPPQTFNETS